MLNELRNYFKLDAGRIYSLDVLRASAIIMVILYHWPRSEHQLFFRAMTHYGYLGVDLFFVLSGYLIIGQSLTRIQKNQFSIRQFYTRRFMRTLPNYFAVLFIAILIYGYDKFDARYFFFLQNIGGLYMLSFSWSLCVEEHFYISVPHILSYLKKRNDFKLIPLITALLFLLGLLIRALIWFKTRPDLMYESNVDQAYEVYFKQIFYPSYTRLDGLAVGGLLAYLQRFQIKMWLNLQNKVSRLFLILVISFIALLLAIYQKTAFFNSVFGFLAVAIFFGAFLVYALSEDNLFGRIKIPGVTFISVLSYSLYLTHGFALHLSEHLISQSPLFANLEHLIRVFFILFFACLLYWGVEKPILLIRNSLLQKKR